MENDHQNSNNCFNLTILLSKSSDGFYHNIWPHGKNIKWMFFVSDFLFLILVKFGALGATPDIFFHKFFIEKYDTFHSTSFSENGV